jgi:hypothetical protein
VGNPRHRPDANLVGIGLLEARIAFLFAQDLYDGHRQVGAEVAAAFGDHEDVVDRIANVDRGAQSSRRLRLTGPDHELHREPAHDGRQALPRVWERCRTTANWARPGGNVERTVARPTECRWRTVEAGVLADTLIQAASRK